MRFFTLAADSLRGERGADRRENHFGSESTRTGHARCARVHAASSWQVARGCTRNPVNKILKKCIVVPERVTDTLGAGAPAEVRTWRAHPRPARTAAPTRRQDAGRRRESPQLSIAVARPICTRPMGGLRTEFAQLICPMCRTRCPPALARHRTCLSAPYSGGLIRCSRPRFPVAPSGRSSRASRSFAHAAASELCRNSATRGTTTSVPRSRSLDWYGAPGLVTRGSRAGELLSFAQVARTRAGGPSERAGARSAPTGASAGFGQLGRTCGDPTKDAYFDAWCFLISSTIAGTAWKRSATRP